ncbi:hypothetical protein Tco_0558157 [Tanacetum coccineum]
MHEYRRLSGELREAVRMRDGYINELQISDSSDEVVDSIETMRRIQVNDMKNRIEDEIGSLETRLNYVGNSAVFIACKWQRLLATVPAVPDIYGVRHAYHGVAPRSTLPFLSFSEEA